jgi:hypothetical protein
MSQIRERGGNVSGRGRGAVMSQGEGEGRKCLRERERGGNVSDKGEGRQCLRYGLCERAQQQIKGLLC